MKGLVEFRWLSGVGIILALVAMAGVCFAAYEQDPSVAFKADDGASYVMVYVSGHMDSGALDEDDLDEFGIDSQLYMEMRNSADNALIAGPRSIANAPSSELPVETDVAYSPDGSQFVVAWAQKTGTGEDSTRNIYFRLFSPDGTAKGLPVKFNTGAANIVYAKPKIAFYNDGSFLIACEGPDSVGIGVKARRFNADGSAIDASEVTLNSFEESEEDTPSIAILPNQTVVVAYEGDDLVGSREAVYGAGESVWYRMFDADLNPQGNDTEIVNTLFSGTDKEFSNPTIVAKDDNAFAIVYEGDLGEDRIFGFFVDSSGIPASNSVFLSSVNEGEQEDASASYHAASDTFVVAWKVVDAGSASFNDSAVVRVFSADASLTPAAEEQPVSGSETGEAGATSIDIYGDLAVVMWHELDFDEGAGEDTDVFFQPFNVVDVYSIRQVPDLAYEQDPGVAFKSDDGTSYALAYVSGHMDPGALDEDDLDEFGIDSQLYLEVRDGVTGALLSGPTSIADAPGELPVESNVAYSPDGSQFVVVWAQKSGTGEDAARNIFFRLFNPDGTAKGAPTQFNTGAANVVYAKPQIAFYNDGTFLIACEGPDSVGIGVKARRFNADGSAIDASEVTLNSFEESEEDTPGIAILPNQTVVMAYEGDDLVGTREAVYGSGESVWYRLFDADLTPQGDDAEIVNTLFSGTEKEFSNPSVVAKDDNAFAIIYEGDLGDDRVFGLFFDSSGAPASNSVFLSSVNEGEQEDIAVSYHANSDHFVVAWRVKDADSAPFNESTIVRLFSADSTLTPVAVEQPISGSETEKSDGTSIDIYGDLAVCAWRDYEFDDSEGETTEVFFRMFGIDAGTGDLETEGMGAPELNDSSITQVDPAYKTSVGSWANYR